MNTILQAHQQEQLEQELYNIFEHSLINNVSLDGATLFNLIVQKGFGEVPMTIYQKCIDYALEELGVIV